MRNEITYEWTLEELEDGDIIDSDFTDTLKADWINRPNTDLGLLYREGNEVDGETDRYYAYVREGKLPEYFSNELNQPLGIKVPQRFHKELANLIKLSL